MHASEYRSLAEGLLSVVLAAARAQMAHFAAGVRVETKSDRSPVTAADRESEEILLAGLARLMPGVAVIAEEAAAAGRTPHLTGSFFLVDPLDGTKQFIRQRPEFTINIGFIEACRPAFGLLYAPAIGDLYVTLGPNAAATAPLLPDAEPRNLDACGLRTIHTRVPDPNALHALVSNAHLNRPTVDFLDRYTVIERKAVASSLKFGLLASGEADLYPRAGPTSEWDTAAGHAILAAAGGTVTTLDGGPMTYGHADRAFINPDFVAWAREPLPPRREI